MEKEDKINNKRDLVYKVNADMSSDRLNYLKDSFSKSFVELRNDFELIKKTIDPSLIRNDFQIIMKTVSRSMVDYNLMLNAKLKDISQLRDYLDANLAVISSTYLHTNSEINSILKTVLPEYLSQIQFISKNAARYFNELMTNPEDSFGSQLMESVSSLETDDSKLNLQKILTDISSQIVSHFKKMTNTNLLNILAIVITIYSIIQNHYDLKGLKEDISSQIHTSQQELIEKLKKLELKFENENNQVFYIVERPTYLFLKPITKSTHSFILFPNTICRIVNKKKKWIYIEYFDFLNGLPRYGWVLKKYCRRIK